MDRNVRRPVGWDDDRRNPRPCGLVDGDHVVGRVSGDAHEMEALAGGDRSRTTSPSSARARPVGGTLHDGVRSPAVWGILLRPLPVAEPERLVRFVNLAYIGELVELRARARTLDVAAYLPLDDRTLTGLDDPRWLSVMSVTGDLLTRLGRTSALGWGIRSRRRASRGRAVRHPQ